MKVESRNIFTIIFWRREFSIRGNIWLNIPSRNIWSNITGNWYWLNKLLKDSDLQIYPPSRSSGKVLILALKYFWSAGVRLPLVPVLFNFFLYYSSIKDPSQGLGCGQVLKNLTDIRVFIVNMPINSLARREFENPRDPRAPPLGNFQIPSGHREFIGIFPQKNRISISNLTAMIQCVIETGWR